MKKAKGATIVTVGKESLKRHTNLWIFLAIALPLVVIGGAIGLVFGLGVFTPTYQIEVTQTDNGNITCSSDSETFAQDSDITYIITPELGYQIDTITVDNEEEDVTTVAGNSQVYIFENIRANHTITATFTTRTYTITYNLNDGTNGVNPTTYTIETATITLANPTKTGSTFGGWYTTNNFSGTAVTGIDLGSVGNKTFYAKWALNEYTITFNSNEGSAVAAITQDYGTAVSAPTAPTKTGFAFAGWYTDNTTFQNQYAFETMPAGNITVYAKWSDALSYNITYILNDGTNGANPTIYTIETSAITLANPTKTGYTFAGWTGTGLTEPTIEVVISTGSTGNRTYTATWSINEYTITFDSNEGSAVDPITQDFATAVIEPADPTRQATAEFTYAFAGWYTDDEAFENGYEFTTMPAGNITVYAKWTATTNQYTVTFKNYDDETLKEEQVAYGSSATAPAETPTKPADVQYTYTFSDWSVDFSNITGDLTVTALYGSEINQYTITFNTNGGTIISPVLANYGTEITAPTDPTKESTAQYTYTFAYWCSDEELTTQYSFGDTLTGDVIIYAKWTEDLRSYTVAFYDHYGLFDTQTVEYGAGAVSPSTNPANYEVVAGDTTYIYAFDYWSLTQDGEEYIGNFTNIIENLTFYAVYTLFDTNTTGTTVTIPSDMDNITPGTFSDLDIDAFEIDGENDNYSTEDGLLYDKNKETLVAVPSGKTGTVTLPTTLTIIGERAFENSTLLEVILPSTVTTVGSNAFSGSTIQSLSTSSDSTTSALVTGDALAGMTDLTEIVVTSDLSQSYPLPTVESDDERYVNVWNDGTDFVTTLQGEGTYTMMSSGSASGGWTYTEDTGLYYITGVPTGSGSLTIPAALTISGVGTVSVYGVGKLINSLNYSTFYITSGIIVIGNGTFEGCTNLNSVIINEGLIEIGNSAFNSCINLSSITIPNSVTRVGPLAFHGTSIYNSKITELEGGYGLIYIENILYSFYGSMPENTEIQVLSGTICIADEAFMRGSSENLISLIIFNGLKSIGNNAFAGCKGLVSITVPDTVYKIGAGAFQNTPWYNNQPDGMVYVGKVAYKYKGSAPFGTTLNFLSDTVGIADGAFNEVGYNITSVNLPSNLKYIGYCNFDRALSGNNISIIIPSSIIEIGDRAFYDCSNVITSITISSPTLIPYSLNMLTYGLWPYINFHNISIYVPSALVASYKSAAGWIEFADRIFAIS